MYMYRIRDEYYVMKKKRKYPRIPREVNVEVVKLEYPMSTKSGEAVTSKNIAQNGICFLSAREYQTDDIVGLKIDLQGLRRHMKSVATLLSESLFNAPLSVVAKVVWSRPETDCKGYEVGALFVNMDNSEYRALNTYLGALAGKSSAQ